VPATIALLPSPLLGHVAWEPVADVLRGRGRDTLVAQLPWKVRGPDDVVRAFRAALPADSELVLVPHSNAGLYTPLLAAEVRPVGSVFVDAALPTTEPSTALAPRALLRSLTDLVDGEGLLPPWSRWWDEAEIVSLFPNDRVRDQVRAGEPRLPLSYFEGLLPVPAGWAAGACGYLAFGDTYAEEVAAARRYGWPTEVLPGRHLHLLHDPEGVADAVLRLLDRLAAAPTG
jgi:hypothetical protein